MKTPNEAWHEMMEDCARIVEDAKFPPLYGSTQHKAEQKAFKSSTKAMDASKAAREATNAVGRVYAAASQKSAGEAHLKAASAYRAVGNEKAAKEHTAKAEAHAEAAGGAWDEDKHPRDENGKFT